MVTGEKCVFDYVAVDSNSLSTDSRMAIEGALPREALREANKYVQWIDGNQNIQCVDKVEL